MLSGVRIWVGQQRLVRRREVVTDEVPGGHVHDPPAEDRCRERRPERLVTTAQRLEVGLAGRLAADLDLVLRVGGAKRRGHAECPVAEGEDHPLSVGIALHRAHHSSGGGLTQAADLL